MTALYAFRDRLLEHKHDIEQQRLVVNEFMIVESDAKYPFNITHDGRHTSGRPLTEHEWDLAFVATRVSSLKVLPWPYSECTSYEDYLNEIPPVTK
jgi:hypothetical protein